MPRSEDERVQEWNLERFLDLGFPVHSALYLVGHKVSAHDAENLIRRGCTPELALAILRPLDDELELPEEPHLERLEPYTLHK